MSRKIVGPPGHLIQRWYPDMNLRDGFDGASMRAEAQEEGPKGGPSLTAEFWERLRDRPYEQEVFQVLRWIDARGGSDRRLGRAGTPRREGLRMRQMPHMVFAPSTFAAAEPPQEGRPARLSIYSFGLFGPNGPLPLHLTEYARERLIHHGDGALTAFADVFHHRLILLFYRAWADAQSAASLDHREEDFSRRLASLLHRLVSARDDETIAPHARYVAAGHLLRQTRNPEGLVQILAAYFGLAIRLHEFHPRWFRLEPDDRLVLGSRALLAQGAVLGAAVRDAQHAFRLELGPMRLADYMQFLPGRKKWRQLRDWVREYVGIEFAWDARLLLDRRDVQGVVLGSPTPLGQASWLGRWPEAMGDAGDLVVEPEVPAAMTL